MKLADVHCHLNHQRFKEDFEEVLNRARKVGVQSIVVSGVNPPGNREVMELCNKYEILKASLGIYPIDALGLHEGESGLPREDKPIDLDSEFRFIEENLDNVISIGEVGMDFKWVSKEETGQKQEENFRRIIQFAIKIKKPLVIHSRKAEKECIDILEEEIKDKEIDVVMHCFGGNKKLMKRAAELGHYFTVPPSVVRSSHFQALVKLIDIKQLLTETDAPYLSPEKDQRNEPAFMIEAIKKIAEIKEMSEQEVAELIWDNYVSVFDKH